MGIEEYIEKQQSNRLFDEDMFRKIAEVNSYDAAQKIHETLIIQNTYQEAIYTYKSFLNYKNAMYDSIISTIKQENPIGDIATQFDLEILNWIEVDEMQDSGYDIEYDFYKDHSNNEAEDVIYYELISDWQKKHNNAHPLSSEDSVKIYYRLQDIYEL